MLPTLYYVFTVFSCVFPETDPASVTLQKKKKKPQHLKVDKVSHESSLHLL